MTKEEKKEVLNGLTILLVLYTTKCTNLSYGLCINTKYIVPRNELTSWLTRNYIQNNKPTIFSKFYNYKNNGGYYWPKEDNNIRIKWLIYHIRKLQKKLK